MEDSRDNESRLWEAIRDQLQAVGIDLSASGCDPVSGAPLRVVCVAGSLGDSVDALGDAARDRVVMVRVDGPTLEALDAWVESGAVKSRSEAAALFIREGLKVRERELRELGDAIKDVDEARERLREKAREVLGADSPSDS